MSLFFSSGSGIFTIQTPSDNGLFLDRNLVGKTCLNLIQINENKFLSILSIFSNYEERTVG